MHMAVGRHPQDATPRSSSASAIASADRVARAPIDDARQQTTPGRRSCAGSYRLPARKAALMVTAGENAVSWTMTVRRRCRARAEPARVHRATSRGAAYPAPAAGTSRPSGVRAASRRAATSATWAGVDGLRRASANRLEIARPRDGLEVADLMGDVGDAVGLEDEPGAQLPLGSRHFILGEAVPSARARSPSSPLPRARQATCLPSPSARRCTETARRRQERAGDGRGKSALDQRGIEPRLALRRRPAEARPEIGPLRACQRRVEHQHRKKIRVLGGRRMPRRT